MEEKNQQTQNRRDFENRDPSNRSGSGNGYNNHKNNYNKKRRYYSKNKRRYDSNKDAEQKSEVAELIEEAAVTEPCDIEHSVEEDAVVETAIPEETSEAITETAEDEKPEKSEVMVEVVGIRFKTSGKTYYFDPAGISARKGEHAIVDTARGLEYGEVSMSNTQVSESDIVPPLRALIRIATEADTEHHLDNKKKEESAFVLCNERITAHKLDMKLIDAQYTFDNTKLLFYFTSAGRVDFRDLVKDLASVFRTRIELRQIGIRDEAKLIGGLGLCGRPLCCSVFLTDFGQVSIKMAKEQNLSLNSSKISGICGRLMCCLRYEHETYDYEIKRTPPVDSTVKTPDGIGTVTEMNPLAGTVKVRLADKPDTPPKSYHRDNLTVISK